jgi:hypothetical protein
MISFIRNLYARNPILYIFGWLCLVGAMIGIVMIFFDNTLVLGINAWIKPVKFLLSIWIFSWTMGWFLYYLQAPGKSLYYSFMVVIVMAFELFVIIWQAANGRLSHFNISSPLYMNLYNAMGIAIGILTIWTAYIAVLFFVKKDFTVPMPYIWGIRLGLIMFVIFSIEGGVMAARLSHTVGAADGGSGIPFVNWSDAYGDLRVAHFFGIHSLQILPLTGFYIARTNRQVFVVALLYFAMVTIMLVQALSQIPLWRS